MSQHLQTHVSSANTAVVMGCSTLPKSSGAVNAACCDYRAICGAPNCRQPVGVATEAPNKLPVVRCPQPCYLVSVRCHEHKTAAAAAAAAAIHTVFFIIIGTTTPTTTAAAAATTRPGTWHRPETERYYRSKFNSIAIVFMPPTAATTITAATIVDVDVVVDVVVVVVVVLGCAAYSTGNCQ